jgi:hypothetical protein
MTIYFGTHGFPRGGDLDRADQLLAACRMLLTDLAFGPDAKAWFWQEIERVRQESKAQIRAQRAAPPPEDFRGQFEGLFKPSPAQQAVQKQLGELFKKQPQVPKDPQRQLEALFGVKTTPTAPTPPASSSAGKPPKITDDDEAKLREQMRKQLEGLFTKRSSR